jgi:hypothetical protein
MRFQVNAGQVISEIIDNEAVMINLTTGNYYSLNGTGAEVWDAIARRETVDEIAVALAGRYQTAAREEVESSVRALVEELRGEGLIVPADDGGSIGSYDGTPSVAPSTGAPFEAPRLEKHTDMQDLILLDPVHEVGEDGWPHVRTDAASHAGEEVTG